MIYDFVTQKSIEIKPEMMSLFNDGTKTIEYEKNDFTEEMRRNKRWISFSLC